MAPLQKRALYSLITGIVLVVVLVVILISQGSVDAFETDLNIRLITYAIFIGIPLIYLILVDITLRKTTQIDERDILIKERSHRIQWVATILTIVTWTIALTEIYQDQGQVPIVFLTLIFISILVITPIAQSLGILIGYWEMNRNG
ncbi:MAG: hypothetical protein P3T54_04580 [Dehalogenimonas sp.]|uniref:DUF2178 domain-containing protein n=1 Tax=Candidatus Dehalogenimonas loeffleri TaxID=3127115 RepID=A0ABZ2J7N0_9CHLR|nr:hypothetical protein [Dehalogenimonas sp.]